MIVQSLLGSVPTGLGSAANSLTSIDLSTNSLSGAIPTTIGSLTAVTYINFSANKLNGTLFALCNVCALRDAVLMYRDSANNDRLNCIVKNIVSLRKQAFEECAVNSLVFGGSYRSSDGAEFVYRCEWIGIV